MQKDDFCAGFSDCGGVWELDFRLANLGFYVVVEVIDGLAESLVVALYAADEHGAFEAADDVVGGCAGINIGADSA